MNPRTTLYALLVLGLLLGCTPAPEPVEAETPDATAEEGVRRIPIETPRGTFEVLAESLPQAGVELYFYDQLGSFRSDRPEEAPLVTRRGVRS